MMLPPGSVPASKLLKLRQMETYSFSVTLSIGLDCPAEELGFGREILALTRNDVSREAQNCGQPEIGAITVLAPSAREASLAPALKGTLAMYMTADIEYGERWRTGPDFERGGAYREFKQDYADVILSRVESELGIDLRSHIEVLAIATPVTDWRYTGNHRSSLMGAPPSRPDIRNRVAGYRTPVRDLLLGEDWAEYGGGVPIATRAGANSALLVLKDVDRSEIRRLRIILDGH